MASTTAGTRLTEAYRLAQGQIGNRTVARLMRVWPLLDPTDLDGTTERWLDAALAVIDSQRNVTANLAAQYLRAFRALEAGAGPFTIPPLSPLNVEQVTTSLLVTGPIKVKDGMGRRGLQEAMQQALVASTGAGDRHAVNGGREVIGNTIQSDTRCRGYQRVTSGKPCGFCAMLASRGPVYFSGSFTDSDPRFYGPGASKVHDHCRCTTEPIYGDTAGTAQGKRYADLYDQVRRDIGFDANAADMRNAFRQALEAQQAA